MEQLHLAAYDFKVYKNHEIRFKSIFIMSTINFRIHDFIYQLVYHHFTIHYYVSLEIITA